MTTTINEDGTASIDDGVHPVKHFSLVSLGDNLLGVLVTGDGVPDGQIPTRFKLSDSGGRVARDEPGVDPGTFIVGPDNTITNG